MMFESQAWQDALLGLISAEQFWYAIGSDLGLESREKIDAFRSRYHADESINEDVLNLIRQLQGQYKLAVLSNNPPGLSAWLSDWGILDLFDVIFCSGDEGVIKPYQEAYNSTLSRLNVLPHEAVFIDDTNGHVKAAQSLGMRGIIFTNAEQLNLELNEILAVR